MAERAKEAGFGARSAAERFVVPVTRAWAGALKAEAGSSEQGEWQARWCAAFNDLASPQAARAWDGFLSLLTRRSRHPVRLGCPCCGWLSADEERLLAGLSGFQHGRPARARSLLAHWLEDDALGLGADFARMFAEHLESGDLVLPPHSDRAIRQITIETMLDAAGADPALRH